MLSVVANSLLTIVYPQACAVCAGSVENRADGVACRNCWARTRVFSGAETLCAKCGRFLREGASGFQTFCRQCDEHLYDAARAVGIYERALAASVIHLKREPFVAKCLQKLSLSRFQTSHFQDADVIIPVPLSNKRFLERGFNQAVVLSEIFSKETALPLDAQTLRRTVHTPMHRAGMDGKARETSVRNAFQVSRPNFIKNKNILLIDDVFTSGATASNCAKALKESGAGKVYVLTVARTI
ncbi:MAG: ComF family protein [Acidobacteria bacterium]|jgi:ComF family protein|nr:ComF family protein [Acidobacteriota bacterium]